MNVYVCQTIVKRYANYILSQLQIIPQLFEKIIPSIAIMCNKVKTANILQKTIYFVSCCQHWPNHNQAKINLD